MGELPEPWNSAAFRVGVRQTLRGIGEAANLSHVTVRRLIFEGRTSPETVAAVADALHTDAATVYRWADIPISDLGPWSPPEQAHRLNPRARAALTELILAITQEDETDAEQPAEARKKTEDRGQYRLAARRGKSTGKRVRSELDEIGTESQEDE